MKKTKVYVNKLPKGCADCICEYDGFCEISGKYVSVAKSKNCPLQTIKQHDRELVKEVCEKIKQYFNENLGNCEEYHCCGFNGKNIEDIYGFLEKLQKEYDK